MASDFTSLAAAAEEEKKKLKEEKKRFKQEQKSQKKEAKRRAAEIAKQEEALGEDGGNGLVTVLATILIVVLWLAVIGVAVFAIIFLACLLAPVISSYDPQMTDLTQMTKPPSMQHLFGTDKLGRDVFTRTLYGGRLSMLIGLGSAMGAAIIGVLLGCYAGYKGGLLDQVILRLSEVFMSFPQLILVIMLGSIFGRGLWNLVIIFIITGWGAVYRQARAKMLSLREEEYVQSMKAFGLNDFVIA